MRIFKRIIKTIIKTIIILITILLGICYLAGVYLIYAFLLYMITSKIIYTREQRKEKANRNPDDITLIC